MRDQAIQMAIGVTFLPRISKHGTELERRQVIQKVELIFKRLLDIVLKLDNIKYMYNLWIILVGIIILKIEFVPQETFMLKSRVTLNCGGNIMEGKKTCQVIFLVFGE